MKFSQLQSVHSQTTEEIQRISEKACGMLGIPAEFGCIIYADVTQEVFSRAGIPIDITGGFCSVQLVEPRNDYGVGPTHYTMDEPTQQSMYESYQQGRLPRCHFWNVVKLDDGSAIIDNYVPKIYQVGQLAGMKNASVREAICVPWDEESANINDTDWYYPIPSVMALAYTFQVKKERTGSGLFEIDEWYQDVIANTEMVLFDKTAFTQIEAAKFVAKTPFN